MVAKTNWKGRIVTWPCAGGDRVSRNPDRKIRHRLRLGQTRQVSDARGVGELLEPFAKETARNHLADKAECDKQLGTRHFKAAVYTPGCILLNPAALVRGLADSLPENVTLFENSQVLSIDHAGGMRVTTPNGEACEETVPRVNVCRAFRLLPDAFCLRRQCLLSRQLTPEEQKLMGTEKTWGVTPSNAFVSVTMRYTSDHRILMRNNIF